MRRNNWLALLLALVMVLTMVPTAAAAAYISEEDVSLGTYGTEPDVSVASAVQANSSAVSVLQVSGQWPAATKTVSSTGDFPLTLRDGDIVELKGDLTVDFRAKTGQSPIAVAANAKAALIISGDVKLYGANASGTTGAAAAIHVPSSSALTIYSGNDKDWADPDHSGETLRLYSLAAYGGSAAQGGAGGNGRENIETTKYSNNVRIDVHTWYTGGGGNGGGGAAAAIGGNGGSGGSGGASEVSRKTKGNGDAEILKYTVNRHGTLGAVDYDELLDDHHGYDGNSGSSGTSGESTGTIYIAGRLALTAAGGSAANGGAGGAGCKGYGAPGGSKADVMIGGNGGGGGGGGGCAAPAIGAGGAGGSGGGSGGHFSSDMTNNVQGCGGGGGGGGWPNGGGGGGGGAECTKALDSDDKSSKGGAGGSGGAAGSSGSSGGTGTSTGTNGHGVSNGKYDAEPGTGGRGAAGITGNAGGGGAGGADNHDSPAYNGGAGGAGGGRVSLTRWNTAGALIFSTANKLALTRSNMSTAFGDGSGYYAAGQEPADNRPNVIYDLRDCTVEFNETTYPGADGKATTSVKSITYTSFTDRDLGDTIPYASNTLPVRAQVSGYDATDKRHCTSAIAYAVGTSDSVRASVTADGAVVGSSKGWFPIQKGTLYEVPVTVKGLTMGVARPGSEIQLSLYEVYATAADKRTDHYTVISSLCKTSDRTGIPSIKWELVEGSVTFTGSTTSRTAKFTPELTNSGQVKIRVTLSDMNDFADYSTLVTVIVAKPFVNGTVTPAQPHPRQPVQITLDDAANVGAVTYQWRKGLLTLDGATTDTYIPTNADGRSGIRLNVIVTPTSDSLYITQTIWVANTVEDHSYDNGFCTVCGEYQEPAQDTDGAYLIDNGGKLFWFAAYVNGDDTHAEAAAEMHPSAKARLTADIDLQDPTDKAAGRVTEWVPIGNTPGQSSRQFTGTFDGQGHTISGMSITTVDVRAGLFASVGTQSPKVNGVVRNFTVEGSITLTEGNSGTNSGVGGAVGCVFAGKVTGVTSRVRISNSSGAPELVHVGGVAGGTETGGVTVEYCVFEGSIDVYNSHDCIGGIVGYANVSTAISFCANRGTVKTTKGSAAYDPYTGGILGYLNNTSATVRNCYNYGKVTGGGNYCGAVIGWLKNGTSAAANITDCYYLQGSAAGPFGKGSAAMVAPPAAKRADQFASGEVCYLVNGSFTPDAQEVGSYWTQNVDNGKTPYKPYPVFGEAAVYSHVDGRYSNDPEQVEVTMSWGAMSFVCTEAWDPNTHVNTVTWTPSAEKCNEITVENTGNVNVSAGFAFESAAVPAVQDCGLTGSFSAGTVTLPRVNGTPQTVALTLSSDKAPTSLTRETKIGTVTVTITASYAG